MKSKKKVNKMEYKQQNQTERVLKCIHNKAQGQQLFINLFRLNLKMV